MLIYIAPATNDEFDSQGKESPLGRIVKQTNSHKHDNHFK